MKLLSAPLLLLVLSRPWFPIVRSQEVEHPPDHQQECLSPQALQECQATLSQNEERHNTLLEEWRHKLNVAVQSVQEERTRDQEHCQHLLSAKGEEHRQDIRQVEGQKAELQRQFEDMQLQLQQQQEAAMESFQRERKQQTAEFDMRLQQEKENLLTECDARVHQFKEEHSLALESSTQEKEKLRSECDAHVTQLRDEHKLELEKSIQQTQEKHSREIEAKQKFHKKTQDELDELKNKLHVLDQKYTFQTNELLNARQELLYANEIVRLYKKGFVRRWFVEPATQYGQMAYDDVLKPLGLEIYSVAYPILDPIYEHIVKPLLTYLIPAWELFCEHMTVAYEYLSVQAKITAVKANELWEAARTHVPVYVEKFIVWVWPYVEKGAKITFAFLATTIETVSIIYGEYVAPLVERFSQEILPKIQATLKDVQKFLLHHWTDFAKLLHSQAKLIDKKHYKLPKRVLDFTGKMARFPRDSLVFLEYFLVIFIILSCVRYVIRALFFSSKKNGEESKEVSDSSTPPNGKKQQAHKKHHVHNKKPRNGNSAVHFANSTKKH